MRRTLLRLVPALVVVLLLAAAASHLRAGGRGATPAMPYPYPPPPPDCDFVVEAQTTGTSTVALPLNGGTIQPLGEISNLSQAKVLVNVGNWAYDFARLSVLSWDPEALAPEPSTVALRSFAFLVSTYANPSMAIGADMVPPLVLRTLSNVAEPIRNTSAVQFNLVPPFDTGIAVNFNPNDGGPAPAGYFQPSPTSTSPLAGAHPVLDYAVCGGSAAAQEWYAVQSVMKTDVAADTAYSAYVQRFRVPVPTSFGWAELAAHFGAGVRGTYDPGVIAIYDASSGNPPDAGTPPLTQAHWYPTGDFIATDQWAPPIDDFTRPIVLLPDHDYWLLARGGHDEDFWLRQRTGGESAGFDAAVGPLYAQLEPGSPWTAQPGLALDFRVIGQPFGVLDVPTPPTSPGATLRLAISPNPSHGAAMVGWSGARGAVRFDVLDARGRRIGGGSAEASASGRWLWRATRADGRPVGAGVYFVHASDATGHVATERVVVVQ